MQRRRAAVVVLTAAVLVGGLSVAATRLARPATVGRPIPPAVAARVAHAERRFMGLSDAWVPQSLAEARRRYPLIARVRFLRNLGAYGHPEPPVYGPNGTILSLTPVPDPIKNMDVVATVEDPIAASGPAAGMKAGDQITITFWLPEGVAAAQAAGWIPAMGEEEIMFLVRNTTDTAKYAVAAPAERYRIAADGAIRPLDLDNPIGQAFYRAPVTAFVRAIKAASP